MSKASEYRNAAPIDVLPWELIRKGWRQAGNPPAYYASLSSVRTVIGNDLAALRKSFKSFLLPSDLASIATIETRALIEMNDEAVFPFNLSGTVDAYSGVKYEVEVVRR